MSDIQLNNQANTDSFEALAADMMTFITSTVTTLIDLAAMDDVSGRDIQSGIAIMGVMGRNIAMDFAQRGIALSGKNVPVDAPAELVEAGNNEDAFDCRRLTR